MRSLTILFFLSAILAAACSDNAAPESRLCAPEDEVDGKCVGATTETLCANAPCTTGTSCDSITTVGDQPSLEAALSSAQPGSCVALKPGNYDSATVPAGVKLLGNGYGSTTVGLVITQGGQTTTLSVLVRGITTHQLYAAIPTEAEQIKVVDGAHIDPTNDKSDIVAVAASSGVSLKLTDVTIEDSTGYGVLATDATALELTRVNVRRNQQVGVWFSAPTAVTARTLFKQTSIALPFMTMVGTGWCCSERRATSKRSM
ncbi:MAG: hypothetical protein U0165_14645 [Polyangiaceae bacterium]